MRIALVAALVMTSGIATADEGQWQPYQMPSIADKLSARGIDIPADKLADLTSYPMNAVVGLGYCTASFVSPQGLVVTNHHCAYKAIQYNSKKEHNYLEQGFLATSKDKEPSAGPNERLYITEEVRNVTSDVIKNLSQEPLTRIEEIESHSKSLIKDCESDENYRCNVRSFHNGLEYYLIKQLMIRDVRLVYAPPESVGAYGGDIDNYEYPRHSGDFAFLRAYVGKDGKPAAYSEDNIPYTPKSYLKINGNGVKAGDGVFVAGYPGTTSRYNLTSELKFASDWLYPTQAKRYQFQIDTIKAMGQEDADIAIKYAGNMASMANRMKKLNGLLEGFKATDIVGIKQQREDDFLAWLKKNPALNQQLISELEVLLAEQQQQYQANYYFSNAQSSSLLTAANQLYRLAKEKQKPDAEREIGYQERDLAMLSSRLKRIDSSFAVSVDKTLWLQDLDAYVSQINRVAALDEMLQLDKADANKANDIKATSTKELSARLDGFYSLTTLTDQAKRLAWMEADVKAFETSTDPFIRLAVALYDANIAQEKAEKTLDGKLSVARPAYMATVIDYYKANNWPVYPDANGTLRISYGMVDGYQSRDALYKQPFTKLDGIVAKHTGVAPYKAPQKLLDAIKEHRIGDHLVQNLYQDPRSWLCRLFSCADKPEEFNSVPVNFLSSVDTTGGNSGSPVFNGQGELVGLNFDSTYEAITKDWFFNPTITRAVHVDIRYILWMMDKVDNAQNLLNEMDIIRD
ncbi:S46 family peptidase [Shewanella acanthi]|uniref:S46 family peptidase n=1 Tax=Shewanella acanthi TaxID=2864212 RepID=UPI001C6607DB|nr:S46 family peptidase [Shewanella acanthi]QYJ79383.1 S46 family peptidase [Shewanella acanthi]